MNTQLPFKAEGTIDGVGGPV
jgi:hypothetical protein